MAGLGGETPLPNGTPKRSWEAAFVAKPEVEEVEECMEPTALCWGPPPLEPDTECCTAATTTMAGRARHPAAPRASEVDMMDTSAGSLPPSMLPRSVMVSLRVQAQARAAGSTPLPAQTLCDMRAVTSFL